MQECQGLPATTPSWERGMEQIFPLNPSKGANPANTLNLSV